MGYRKEIQRVKEYFGDSIKDLKITITNKELDWQRPEGHSYVNLENGEICLYVKEFKCEEGIFSHYCMNLLAKNLLGKSLKIHPMTSALLHEIGHYFMPPSVVNFDWSDNFFVNSPEEYRNMPKEHIADLFAIYKANEIFGGEK